VKQMIFLIAFALLLAACAGPATTPEEFKNMASSSSMAKAEHFPVKNGTLNDAQNRFAEFSERCLNVQLTMQHCGTFNCGQPHAYAGYIPRLVREPGIVRLTLQRHENAKVMLGPNDFYIMVAEVEQTKEGLQGHVYAPKIGYGDLFGSAKGWTSGGDKTCPNL
jgi:hypothetical protein